MTASYTTYDVKGYFPVLYLHHCLQSVLCWSEIQVTAAWKILKILEYCAMTQILPSSTKQDTGCRQMLGSVEKFLSQFLVESMR